MTKTSKGLDEIYNKGMSLDDLGRYEEAIESYNKVLELNPNHVKALNNKGSSLDALARYEEAIDCYEKALELKPNDDILWFNKGTALRNLERYEEALQCYDKALELNPDFEHAWNGKGTVAFRLGRHEEAIEHFDKALEINPNYAEALYNKGISLRKLGRNEEIIMTKESSELEAQTMLIQTEEKLKIFPESNELWYVKAHFLFKLGKIEEGYHCLKKSLEIDPQFIEALIMKSQFLFKMKRYKEALTSVENSLKIHPRSERLWRIKADIFFELFEFENAIKSYQEVLKINPNNNHSLESIKRTKMIIKEFKPAIRSDSVSQKEELDKNMNELQGFEHAWIVTYNKRMASYKSLKKIDLSYNDDNFEGYFFVFDFENEKKKKKMNNPNEIVISSKDISIHFSYPLSTLVKFKYQNKKGFSRMDLFRFIYEGYSKIYDEEAMEVGDPGAYICSTNRRRSYGKYGIWGHYLEHLLIEEVYYSPQYKTVEMVIGS